MRLFLDLKSWWAQLSVLWSGYQFLFFQFCPVRNFLICGSNPLSVEKEHCLLNHCKAIFALWKSWWAQLIPLWIGCQFFLLQFCPVGNFVICQSNPLSVVERGSPIVQPTTYLNQNITNGWRLKSLGTGGFLSLSYEVVFSVVIYSRKREGVGRYNIILCRKTMYNYTYTIRGWLHTLEYTHLLLIVNTVSDLRIWLGIPSHIFWMLTGNTVSN